MTIDEAHAIIAKTNSPYLKRDMEKFIKRQRRKDGVYGKAKKGNRSEAVREPLRPAMHS